MKIVYVMVDSKYKIFYFRNFLFKINIELKVKFFFMFLCICLWKICFKYFFWRRVKDELIVVKSLCLVVCYFCM